MTDMAERITIVSAERVRDELVKLVCAPRPRGGLTPARRDRAGPAQSCRSCRPWRSSATSTTGTRTSTSTRSPCWSRPSTSRTGCPGAAPTSWPLRRAHARRRQAAALASSSPTGRSPSTTTTSSGRRSPEADAGAAVLLRRDHGGRQARRAAPALPRVRRGPVDRLGRPALRPGRGDLLPWLHVLTRADCTTRNQRKADRLRRSYDELEARIARLSEEEELASIRPDLDGNQIMEILGDPGGPAGRRGVPVPAGAAPGPRSDGRTTRPVRHCWRGPPGGGSLRGGFTT